MSAKGFSLVEILIASVIVVLAILPAISVLLSSSESLRQTRTYYQAVFLGNLLTEEVRVGAQEDNHFLDSIVEVAGGPFPVGRKERSQSIHPFLAVLEDSEEPRGRLVPDADLCIQPEAGPLYPVTEPLTVRMDLVQESDFRYYAFRFEWKSRDGKTRTHTMGTPATPAIERHRIEGLEDPGTTAPDTPLGSLEEVLRLGAIAERVVQDAQQKLALLPPAIRYPGDRAAWERAKLHEGVVARLTEITQWILPHMVRLGQPSAGSLGHDMEKLRETERRMILVLDELWRNLRLTIVEGDRTASAPGFSLGERFKAHQLVLRAMKLSYAVQGGDPGALASWCQGVAGFYDGRMVHAFHHFLEEARAVTRPEEDYPLRPAALKIREACEALLDAVIELRLQPSGRVAGQPVPDPDP